MSIYSVHQDLQIDVISANGTIPVAYKGVTYYIPLRICLLKNYPASAPRVTVIPNANMCIPQNHPHVGVDGVVDIPLLRSWNGYSNLVALVRELTSLFQQKMPVFDRRAQARPASSGGRRSPIVKESSSNKVKETGDLPSRQQNPVLHSHSDSMEVKMTKVISDLEARYNELMRTNQQLDAQKSALARQSVSFT